MPGWLLVTLVVVAVVYTIVRRSIGEPLNARDLFGPPVVLLVIGGISVVRIDGVTPVDIAWLVGTSLVGVAFGLWRGSTVTLMTKNGVLWQRYPARTYVVWVISFVVNGALGFLATRAGMHEEVRPMTLSIGVSLLGEAAAVGLRALSTGLPFSPERRDDHRGLPRRADFAQLSRQPALRDWLRR